LKERKKVKKKTTLKRVCVLFRGMETSRDERPIKTWPPCLPHLVSSCW
jgi:hypothetical protein